jgi:hypothetical protein
MRPDLDLNDLITHRLAWRAALVGMITLAEQNDSGEDQADASYWRHELAAFDRTFSIFHDGRGEGPAEWQDWEGGDGPPPGAIGKNIDVLGAGEPDQGPGSWWEGPASVYDWSLPCRWRPSAEQPEQ